MSGSKKKYYAVLRGREPGIYQKWFGPDGAEAQVRGFAGARYKGFATIEEARQWFAEPGASPSAPRSRAGSKSAGKNGTQPASIEPDDGDRVVVYTDGGCLNNPGPGGYGAIVQHRGQRRELSGGFRLTTNNRMELTACIVALEALDGSQSVVLYSDSSYVVNGIEKGWARNWRRKGWLRSGNEPAENADLWNRLLALCERHRVRFNWVRGHAGNPGNERCDQLANRAARDESNHSRDRAFETGRTRGPDADF